MQYSTIEAANELIKNPNLIFEWEYDENSKFKLFAVKVKDSVKIQKQLDNNEPKTLKLDAVMLSELTKWTKVKQPVTFMEAVKAYSEGKKIECHYKVYNDRVVISIYNNNKERLMRNQFIDQHLEAISCKEILEGTWYIEE